MKYLIGLMGFLFLITSCQPSGDSLGVKTLDTTMDSISYAMGESYIDMFSELGLNLNPTELAEGLSAGQTDSTDALMVQAQVEAFSAEMGKRQNKPFEEGEVAPFNVDTISYAVGWSIGAQLREIDGDELSVNALYQGAADKLDEATVSMVGDQQQRLQQTYSMQMQQKMQAKKMAEAKAQAGPNIAAGQAFLAEKAKDPNVKSTESGLHYEVLTAGTGTSPKATDQVKVHYHGTLLDGTVFDSSVDRGEPTSFFLNQVITGWTEGLQLMKEGAKYRFYIPQELAYGEPGRPGIPPGATLIFDVELLEILNAEK